MAQLSGITSRRDYEDNNEGVRRHCGKTAPEDFIDGDSAVELVFHTNQGDACKGFAFQYRLETSKFSTDMSEMIQPILTAAWVKLLMASLHAVQGTGFETFE